MSHQFMAFEIADFVAEGISNSKKKKKKKKKRKNIANVFFCRLILYIFHKVWRLLMPKYPLGKCH